MNMKIVEGMLVVSSGITVKEIQDACMYAPESLVVKDAEGNEVYAVATNISRGEVINNVSFSANSLSNSLSTEKELQFTMSIQVNPHLTQEASLNQIKEQLGQALVNAAKYLPVIKEQIKEAVAPIEQLMLDLTF